MRFAIGALAGLCFLFGTVDALLGRGAVAGVLPMLYAIFFAIIATGLDQKPK